MEVVLRSQLDNMIVCKNMKNTESGLVNDGTIQISISINRDQKKLEILTKICVFCTQFCQNFYATTGISFKGKLRESETVVLNI